LYSTIELLKSFYGDIFNYDVRMNQYSINDIESIIDNQEIKLIFNKWTDYLNKLSSINNSKSLFLDVRLTNFGYDHEKNLKMFDI
jgi:hypothetical protein